MRHETATRSQSVRLELSLATRRTLHMQWFQLGFALDHRKSKGFSLRHATQALLHDHAQRDFTYKIASKHLKAKTCRKAQTTKHQRVLLCCGDTHFLRSSPPAPMPSLPRRNGRSPLDPPRPCVAWRVESPYQSSHSALHPRGDAIPNPFPHQHSESVIANIAFHLRFVDVNAGNIRIPRTQHK